MPNYLSNDSYYQTERSGSYQFTSLDDIINHFMVAYVGEDKIISRARRVDVAFHAQRAMQELSFDTFRSVKAQEITVPSTLTMPVPPDYVNYTKIAWSDSSGIEHVLYPTSKTSNPQYDGNLIDFHDGHFVTDASNWTLGTGFSWTNQNKTGGAIIGGTADDSGILTSVSVGTKIKYEVEGIKHGRTYKVQWNTHAIEDVNQAEGGFKVVLYGEQGYKATLGRDTTQDYHTYNVGEGLRTASIYLHPQNAQWETTTDTDSNTLMFEVVDKAWVGILDSVVLVELEPSYKGNQISNLNEGASISATWSNYKATTSSENNDDYEDDVFWPYLGQRYGLDPQHSQTNGSFYIDAGTGLIHFSSNISGKTVIIKYISDSLGTLEELQVHKFAEEAMYKWIMHAILSTKANIPVSYTHLTLPTNREV